MNIEELQELRELQSLQERVKKLEKSIDWNEPIVEKMSTMQKNIAFISIFQKILNIILICAIAGFIFVYKYDIIPLMHDINDDKHEIIKEINDLEDEIKSSK